MTAFLKMEPVRSVMEKQFHSRTGRKLYDLWLQMNPFRIVWFASSEHSIVVLTESNKCKVIDQPRNFKT